MRVKDHWKYTNHELEELFQTYQLKPGMFTHEAHIRLAYIHLTKYGRSRAEENMCQQIEGYAKSLNYSDKFNRTVTIASVRILDKLMSKSSFTSFEDFLEQHPQVLQDFKAILSRHYSYNVFADPKAKKIYQAPDILPF